MKRKEAYKYSSYAYMISKDIIGDMYKECHPAGKAMDIRPFLFSQITKSLWERIDNTSKGTEIDLYKWLKEETKRVAETSYTFLKFKDTYKVVKNYVARHVKYIDEFENRGPDESIELKGDSWETIKNNSLHYCIH